MTVRVYSSADVGAPPLRGNSPGDFIALLTACLVTGYGSKTGAGWTREFVNVDQTIAAFKQGLGSNGMYLRMDDTQVIAATGNRAARVVGYETMSDLNTGLPGPFPSNAQVSGGLVWPTISNDTNSFNGRNTARPWIMVADERFFWLNSGTSPTGTNVRNYRELFFFGDSNSFNPADAFNTYISGWPTISGSNSTSNAHPASSGVSSMASASSGFYVARSNDQVAGPTAAGHHVDYVKSGSQTWGTVSGGGMGYPNAADGAIHMSPVWVTEPTGGVLRGVLPGMWPILGITNTLNNGDTFDGQGQMAGKRFIVISMGQISQPSNLAIEISDTWR